MLLRFKPIAAALLILLVSSSLPGSSAQQSPGMRRVPSSTQEVQLSFAPVVQRVAPSVVNVYAARVVSNRNPFLDDPIFRRFFGGGAPSEQVQRSLGSG